MKRRLARQGGSSKDPSGDENEKDDEGPRREPRQQGYDGPGGGAHELTPAKKHNAKKRAYRPASARAPRRSCFAP